MKKILDGFKRELALKENEEGWYTTNTLDVKYAEHEDGRYFIFNRPDEPNTGILFSLQLGVTVPMMNLNDAVVRGCLVIKFQFRPMPTNEPRLLPDLSF